MNDYSPIASSLRTLPILGSNQATTASTSTAATTASGLDQGNFQQLMTTLLLGLSLQNMFGSSSDSLGSSDLSGLTSDLSGQASSSQDMLGLNNIMAPLMISMLEKLLAQDIRSDASATTATSTPQPINIAANASTPENNITAQTGQSVPQGAPVKGILTQGSRAGHIALDFGIPVGTNVKSTMDGKVVYAGWNNEGYGNLVIVENGPYRTYYAHLSEIPVKVGQQVGAGSVIGLSGNTGNSTGPHLHYEVRKNGVQLDPSGFIAKKAA